MLVKTSITGLTRFTDTLRSKLQCCSCWAKSPRFFSFIAAVVVKVLTVLQPPNAMLQAKTVNMCHAVDMIQSAVRMLELIRSDDTFSSLASDAGKL